MLKFISPFNNVIKILHFPGTRTFERRLALKRHSTFKIKRIPENLTIITTANDYFRENAILIKQLKASNIQFINAVSEDTKSWNNRFKIRYILDTLKNITTEYCLILDSIDVAIVDNLDNIIDDFKTYNVGALYNGTTEEFPTIQIEEIPNRVENYGPYSFFNAGCCIGETDALLKIYEEAQEIIDNTNLEEDSHSNSEQYFMRQVYAKHLNDGLIGVDWQCKIFQCWRNLKFNLIKFDGKEFIQKLESTTDQDKVKNIIKNIKLANAEVAYAAVDTDLTDDL